MQNDGHMPQFCTDMLSRVMYKMYKWIKLADRLLAVAAAIESGINVVVCILFMYDKMSSMLSLHSVPNSPFERKSNKKQWQCKTAVCDLRHYCSVMHHTVSALYRSVSHLIILIEVCDLRHS